MSVLFNAAKKDMLRQIYRDKRRDLSPEFCQEQDSALCRIISDLPEFAAAETVLLYAPLGAEIDVLPLFDVAKKRGKRVAFPLCDPKNKTMAFHYVDNISDLNVGSLVPNSIIPPRYITPILSEMNLTTDRSWEMNT